MCSHVYPAHEDRILAEQLSLEQASGLDMLVKNAV
jgi:hypothetical protein